MATGDVQGRFIERMGAALTAMGMPRLPSRVLAALVVDEDGRMTASEVADAVGVSPASVSTAVKYLGQVSFLYRERERGSRRDVYVVEDDIWLRALRRESEGYAPMLDALATAIDELGEDHPSRRRLVLMREFLLFVEEELQEMGRRWEQRRRALGLD